MATAADRARFGDLFEAHYSAMLAYARRRCGRADGIDADDVVADTFTTAWRRRSTLFAADEPRAWLYAVARRTLANHRRAAGRRSRLAGRLLAAAPAGLRSAQVVDAVLDASDDGSDDASDDRAGAVRVRIALAQLRPADREILQLHAWEGLAARELAVVLGCSPNAAALRLSRARVRLACALAADDRIGDDRTQGVAEVSDHD